VVSHPISWSGARRLVAARVVIGLLTATIAVVSVAALTFNARTAAGQGPGPGSGCFTTSGPVCTYTHHVAVAEFDNVSADGCTFTQAFVNPFEALTSPGRVAATTVQVSASTFDICTGTFVQALNFDPTTGNPIFSGTVQFSTLLDTAVVIGSAPMFDGTGTQLFTSSINVTWQAYGPSSSFVDGFHFRGPGFLENIRLMGTSRAAEASGQITDEIGSNLATQPTLNASIEDAQGGTVSLSLP